MSEQYTRPLLGEELKAALNTYSYALDRKGKESDPSLTMVRIIAGQIYELAPAELKERDENEDLEFSLDPAESVEFFRKMYSYYTQLDSSSALKSLLKKFGYMRPKFLRSEELVHTNGELSDTDLSLSLSDSKLVRIVSMIHDENAVLDLYGRRLYLDIHLDTILGGRKRTLFKDYETIEEIKPEFPRDPVNTSPDVNRKDLEAISEGLLAVKNYRQSTQHGFRLYINEETEPSSEVQYENADGE